MTDGDANRALPNGWTATTMGEVAQVVGGGTPKTTIPGNFSAEEGHPWLTPADLTGYQNKHVSRGRRNLTDQGLAGSSAKYMPEGTILFSSRAPVGYCVIASNPITTNQGFRSFVPSDALDADYAYHYLKSITALAEQLASGTTFNELSGSKAKTLPLPLPPLAEQRRIASRLDEIDARCAATAAHLHSARTIAGRFRSAALASAYAEAHDLDGTEVAAPLAQLLREPLKNGYSARPAGHETPYRVLTLTATTSGIFDPRHFKYTDESFSRDSPLWLAPGDIVIQRGNTAEYVGVPALYEGEPGKFLYPDLMIRARVKQEIDPRFVWYMLLAPQARSFLRERATGTAGNMPKINQKTLNTLPIPLPHSNARASIVERLDRAFELAGATMKRLDSTAAQLARTKRAALTKAFRGELVPTEAALAADDGRDFESAEQLLARVIAGLAPRSKPRKARGAAR